MSAALLAPPQMRPKPTMYRGVRMASRLESQWAVFFDECGIRWAYEPFRLRLPDEVADYLPDFHLPGVATWFEAKGNLEPESIAKPMALWRMVGGAGQKVVVGTSNGRVAVPWRRPDGSVSMDGVCVRCSCCGKVWFANVEDPEAAACRGCGSGEGGAATVEAASAAFSAGLSPGWPGRFDPLRYRTLVRDA